MKTRNTICGLVCGAALLAITGTASANLITNGSFEQPDLNGSWGTFTSIPGWTAVGNYPIEIGAGSIYGVTGYEGKQVMELDSTGNAWVASVLGTVPGGSYPLSFLYARRAGSQSDPNSSDFEVFWNNTSLGYFSPTSPTMSIFSGSVIALGGGNDVLVFVGKGLQNTYGAIIDDVKLGVPDGGMSAMLLGMGLLAVGMGRKLVN